MGENLLPLLVLALGGALVIGTSAALIRPPANPDPDQLERPPLARSLIQILIGLVAAVWAIGSLTS